MDDDMYMVIIFGITLQCTFYCGIVHNNLNLLFIILNTTPYKWPLWSLVNEVNNNYLNVV